MKIQVNRYTEQVTSLERQGKLSIVDLKPRARKNHLYELTLPDNTEHHYVAPNRIGYYGHTEYIIEPGLKLVVSKSFGEDTAYTNKAS